MIRDDAAGRIRQILGFRTDLFNESLDAIREAQEDAEAGNSVSCLGFYVVQQDILYPLERRI